VRRGWSNMRSAELVGVAQPVACCGEICSAGYWREIDQRRMRPPLVVIVGLGRNLGPGVIETKEQALIEKLVAHAAVEALAEAVLHRLSRRDEMPDDPVFLRPSEHGVQCELGPVVGDDHTGFAALLHQRLQFSRHAPAGDRGVGDRRQAFARHVLDDVEDPEPPAAGELVVDEIQRPAGVGDSLDEDRRPGSHGAPPRPPLAHREAFFAVKSINAVDPRRFAVLTQQNEQPPIAKMSPCVGEVAQLCPKARVWRSA
jgi:hypothetical protein